MDTVSDPVRFTFTYGPQRYAEGTLSDVERLKSEGFELVKLKNLWTDDQYKGINSQWRRPETGLRFEIQFHTLGEPWRPRNSRIRHTSVSVVRFSQRL